MLSKAKIKLIQSLEQKKKRREEQLFVAEGPKVVGDLLPYFSSDIVFDQSNVRKALGDEILDWEYGVKSLEALVKSFYVDHFSDTEWIQDLMNR